MATCGYCGGKAIRSPDMRDSFYVHAEDGARIKNIQPGDLVSARHNRAGSRVLAVDLVDDED